METAQPIPTTVKRCVEEVSSNASCGTGLSISWSDNTENYIPSTTLRKNCPCATCREVRGEASHNKPLSTPRSSRLNVISATLAEETNLQLVWPVGNYALGIKWGDGHDSGIYPYSLLKTLTEG